MGFRISYNDVIGKTIETPERSVPTDTPTYDPTELHAKNDKPNPSNTSSLVLAPPNTTTAAFPADITVTPVTVANPRHLNVDSGEMTSYALAIIVTAKNRNALIAYFGKLPGVAARLAKYADGKVPLEAFLPDAPRKRMNSLPTPEILDGDNGANCYSTSLHFFDRDFPIRHDDDNNGGKYDAYLKRDARRIGDGATRPLRFGDILRAPGHTARVLLTDRTGRVWVFHKSSGYDSHPWRIATMQSSFALDQPATNRDGDIRDTLTVDKIEVWRPTKF
ncbi:MAG: hypothetical protein H7Z43_13660 [Clostridia bacterium]|nr:hypothetical protein [Deltaproteobacteria bacterium]